MVDPLAVVTREKFRIKRVDFPYKDIYVDSVYRLLDM